MDIAIKHISHNDDIMKDIIQKVGECQIGKNQQSPFSYFVGLIIGQKIKFGMAKKIRSNMYTETKSYNFAPNDILNLTDENWESIQIDSIQKKNTIIKVAKYFIDNKVNPNKIKKNDLSELHKISGIGIWTVSTFMIEYGIDNNLFPLNDKHVNKKLSELYNIDESDISEFIEKWSPYKSYAFWYLWKIGLN